MESRARKLRSSCRRWLGVGAALVLLAAPAGTSELIRYRGSDGSVGFAGSASSVPPGAVILTREASSKDAPRETGANAPSIGALVSAVRRQCESKHRRGVDEFDDCITDQTRAAFEFRDVVLEQRPGSESFRLIEGCRRRWEKGRRADYRRLMRCTDRAQEEFESRTGMHPAAVDVDRVGSEAERDRRREHEARLRGLRNDQAKAARDMEIGRNRWRPRYEKAERELREAEQKTQEIIQKMRRRGCRTDTLACGGLGPQLAAAQKKEAAKRNYLDDGLLNECRLAGCQPGWLR